MRLREMAMCANGLAKLLEEMGELAQVCAKKLAYYDTDAHPDGSSLRERMQEEVADVMAAIEFVIREHGLNRREIERRVQRKYDLFCEWHKQVDNDQGFLATTGAPND